ncbi:hypothetical protein [Streptomyces sp. NPDC088707]|uniref:hypothetical protein n=1 Tax=Streptomyces sp. NPDC088707 TaxID=3365871 RepID=UPI00381D8013
MTDLVVEVGAEVTSDELNVLFRAAWPGHRDTDFGPVLSRSLLRVTPAAPGGSSGT